MMTELCEGPSALQTPHNGGDGLRQWIRTEDTESEVRDPDSSPSCHQWCVALGKSFLSCPLVASFGKWQE